MAAQNSPATDNVDAIDFAAAARLLWRYKRLVIGVSLLFGVAALLISLTLKPYYKAEAVVVYVHDRSMGDKNGGSIDEALGGLASLAGMNLLSGGADDQESLAVLDSHYLAELFIQRNDLIPVLLKKKKSKQPTMWKAVKVLKDGVVVVRKDPRKGTTTIAATWKDAQVAARWANGYVALANELIRQKAIDETKRNVTYLNEQIARTTDEDLRRVLYNMVEAETKTLMIASGRTEYAFQVVDPAVAPEIKAGPHRSLIVLGGLLLGFCLAGGIAFAHDRIGWRRRAHAPQTGNLVPVPQA